MTKVLLFASSFLQLILFFFLSEGNPLPNCQSIYEKNPNAKSGAYWLMVNGVRFKVSLPSMPILIIVHFIFLIAYRGINLAMKRFSITCCEGRLISEKVSLLSRIEKTEISDTKFWFMQRIGAILLNTGMPGASR